MNRFLKITLSPISLLYGLLMACRNLMFRTGLLKSTTFQVPVISVGNLSAGGTGKTPQTEYLIRLLSPRFKTATLSRGYGRKSSGFHEANPQDDVARTGDEPLQFCRKFQQVVVAVDERRTRGARILLERHPDLEVILLDDAYQHRYIKPGLSLLLTDYRALFHEDMPLPSGTLREFRSGAVRADIIIVTKTPRIFSPITRRRILEEMHPAPHQRVFFSYLNYGALVPLFDYQEEVPPKLISILLFTGIANDYPLREHLERQCSDLNIIKFQDHHQYSRRDIQEIIRRFQDLPTQKKIMVTTEKDCMRLKNQEFAVLFKNLPLFCIPIESEFHGEDKANFDEIILNYVAKDRRNR